MDRDATGEQEAASRQEGRREWIRAILRALRYLGIRAFIIAITVLVGIYAAIWVTNLGGAGDESRRSDIRAMIVMASRGPHWREMTQEERERVLEATFQAAYRAADLDKPFFIRSFRYFREALTFSLGESSFRSLSGSNRVIDILLESLPLTLLIFGFANLITFLVGLAVSLALSRRYGTLVDRAATLLVPLFAAPPWFHGLFLIVIFAILLKVLPFGGLLGSTIPQTQLSYVLTVAKHMLLPVTATVLGTLPFAVYTNRALFLIHSSDDHVEMAKAKGLRANRLQRRYVLRPVLPAVVTNFAFLALVAWEAVIITEAVFNWPGLGRLVLDAIRAYEVSVVIGAVTMLAYLLGLTVLFLDILYVIVDPRVKLGGGGRA